MDTIGVRIRKIREERGIIQEFIAEQMGIGQSTYSRLEKDDCIQRDLSKKPSKLKTAQRPTNHLVF
ncbi:MAG: helix-turn-helix domain-containing protein [Tannerella sp.]|jgi:transcriptional regulator with XRE-family HTH domain|nr:helix-turn-helix domain-containing protein [Tannerella sp.]